MSLLQVFFSGANVRQVDVPTLTGAFGILAAHVPTLQVLRPGMVVVHAEDGTTSKYFGESSRRTEDWAEQSCTLQSVSPRSSWYGKRKCCGHSEDTAGSFFAASSFLLAVVQKLVGG